MPVLVLEIDWLGRLIASHDYSSCSSLIRSVSVITNDTISQKAADPMSTLVPFSNAEFIAVAERQRAVIWMIPVTLATWVAIVILDTMTQNSLFSALTWIPGIVSTVFVWHLAKAVKVSPIVYAALSMLPLVGLITLLILNSRATGLLSGRGIRLGLMGARQADLKAVRQLRA